ncbi:copper amine oxidase N-terminal domain-containing protein [Paenibacillus kobensis]|uniref:copper amine oxidase N-terminal domain-containing protein n=1 Tax=Paenibacillus kobensis TaxID=59841 RepID=UPI000FDCA15D|nr:copper amine oxidase N-terminal domain-containing protein [Paenibacillus kobensis]
MNKIKSVMLASMLGLALLPMSSVWAAPKFSVVIDGKSYTLEQEPINRKGSLLVPFGPIFKALDIPVQWNNESKTVTASKGKLNIEITVGYPGAIVNDDWVELDASAETIGGRVYVPLRFIGESTGNDVKWDKTSNSVIFTNRMAQQLASVKGYSSALFDSKGTPYDASAADQIAPSSWSNNYGSAPEIITYVNPDQRITVAWDDEKEVHISELTDSYSVAASLSFAKPYEMFGGMVKDDQGNYYVLYAKPNKDEDMSSNVKLVKFDKSGSQTGVYDLPTDNKTGFDVMTPISHAGSRLAYGNHQVAVHMGKTQHKNTSDGLNHQSGILFVVNTDAMTLDEEASMHWTASHSFDQRLIYDGHDFVLLDLADNYPRGFYLTKQQSGQVVFTFKTEHDNDPVNPAGKNLGAYKWSNDNKTYSELGGLVQTDSGYIVLGSSEKTFDNNKTSDYLNESRNLFIVHVVQNFNEQSTEEYDGDSQWNIVSKHVVDSVGQDSPLNHFYDFNGGINYQKQVGVVWLTDFTDKNKENAVRPKLVKLESGKYAVVWEKWTADQYVSTQYMLIDDKGTIMKPVTDIGPLRLNRGDDITAVGNKLVRVTGDSMNNQLRVNVIDTDK